MNLKTTQTDRRFRPANWAAMICPAVFALIVSTFLGPRPVFAQAPASQSRVLDSPARLETSEKVRRDCLVVCPAMFQEALLPWVEYRSGQGFTVTLVTPAASAQETKRHLVRAGLDRDALAIVLVGDCRITAAETADITREVPTFYRLPGPTAKFGTTKTLAGDAPYGDVDADGVPEVAVGRLPVDSAVQLDHIVQRIMAYESSSDFGHWRDTVQITAGVGGFGTLADAAIESATKSLLSATVPDAINLCVTYCSPSSSFNPGPNDFFPCVIRRYREGGLFWVYMGHGQVTELDRVPSPGGGRRPVLSTHDVSLLERPATAAPIAVMLACYTGAFDATVDCLAENMVLSEGGPIAVLAGSRVTMPYGNAIAAQGLIHAVYNQKEERLGTAWLAAQKELATESADDRQLAERRKLVDMLASVVSPVADMLPEERREHIHLYNLLGDPLLRLVHPGEIELDIPVGVAPGETIRVSGTAPHEGDLSIVIRYLPGNVPIDPGLSRLEQYNQANKGQIAKLDLVERPAGPFEAELTVPHRVKGPMHVVARIHNSTRWSIGAKRILVRPSPASRQ